MQICNYGEPYTLPNSPTMTGKNFLGWYTENGAPVTSQTIVSIESEHILTAKWADAHTHAMGGGSRRFAREGSSISLFQNTKSAQKQLLLDAFSTFFACRITQKP